MQTRVGFFIKKKRTKKKNYVINNEKKKCLETSFFSWLYEKFRANSRSSHKVSLFCIRELYHYKYIS